jgi:hypothetical protein
MLRKLFRLLSIDGVRGSTDELFLTVSLEGGTRTRDVMLFHIAAHSAALLSSKTTKTAVSHSTHSMVSVVSVVSLGSLVFGGACVRLSVGFNVCVL